jgi:hypothetical protein
MLKYYTSALLLLLSVALVRGQDPGFFLDDWQEKTAILPSYEWKEKTSKDANVLLRVDADQVLKKVPRYIYGNNAVTWGGNMNLHATIMTDINNLNPHVLRWPGGNLSQEYFWNLSEEEAPGDVQTGISPRYGVNDDNWQMSTDDFYDLLKNTNSTGSICVNYSYARYGTGPDPVAKAAHLAAEWVRYDKGRTKFWEIGNENFGNWEAGYKIETSQNQDGQPEYISGRLYGQHCRVFIDSMRAAAAEVGADIKIGVVAFDAEDSYDPINTNWNEGMMPEVGDLADFLIVHSYFTPYNQDSNIPTILNSHDVTSHIMDAIKSDMDEAGKEMIPVAMTEWNIFAVGSMQQVSYINGMHAALVLGELVQNDYGMATRWDLTNGWADGNDHGMFSRAGEPGVDHYNPRPVFFYMKYFQDYFGDQVVASTVTGSEEVIAYASTFSSGEAGLVLVNKGGAGETVQLELENFDVGARYYTMTLTGGDDKVDFSRKVFLNGIGGDEEGGGPDDYESVLAYGSSTREGIRVDLPPLSVVYLMVEQRGPLSYVSSNIQSDPQVIQVELSEEVLAISDPAGFELILNGSTSVAIRAIERDQDHPWLLTLTLDQTIHKGEKLLLSYSEGSVITSEGELLPPFTNQPVSNLLPGDPFQIIFRLRIADTELPVGNCQLSFNGVSAWSDESGQVSFLEPEGTYAFTANKLHLIPVEDLRYSIYSDTLIDVALDSVAYLVKFLVTDSKSGKTLPGVDCITGPTLETTGTDGSAHFMLHAGSHPFRMEALNYLEKEIRTSISSDTSFAVVLEQSHARVKFKLLSGLQPVDKALVALGRDSLYTGQLGICNFESIRLGEELDCLIERDNYYSQNFTFITLGDTTLSLQMIKSVANVNFELRSESGPVTDAMVVLEQDTAYVSPAGLCKFYQLPKEVAFDYQVIGEAYQLVSGSLTIKQDTTVLIAMALTTAPDLDSEGFRMYPNPAADRFVVESQLPVQRVEVMNLFGELLQSLSGESKQRVEVPIHLAPGIYLVRVSFPNGNQSIRTLVRH